MSLLAVSQNQGDWALFLDIDGTLLKIAETPSSVQVPEGLRQLLFTLALRLDGALALISGRALSSIDDIFAPLKLCAAGVHGCEHREANGCVVKPLVDPQRLQTARLSLDALVARHDGLLLEDKGYALALHYRLAPHCAGIAESAVNSACNALGPEFAIQKGKCVLEIRPAECSKGGAILAFMRNAPFHGRRPIFVGDDVTDESAFSAVNCLGGVSIKVGAGDMLAHHRVADVDDVLLWLATFAEQRAVDQPAA